MVNPALPRGRESYAAADWRAALDRLSRADEAAPLDPADLELLGTAAYMLGQDGRYAACLERAHHGHLAAGSRPRAARCAFWIGHNRLFRGDPVQANGWFARAQRVLGELECVEAGYLLIPSWLGQMSRGDFENGLHTAAQAAAIGERFADPDLTWLARDDQGRALLNMGRVEEGRSLVDETMIVATSGELSPIVTGIVFCNTLAFCQDALELDRAREWTAALSRWCNRQPAMVEHNGLCQVHRAEVLELGGAWSEALAAAQRAADRFAEGVLNQFAAGKARYRQGEVHRLRGDIDAADGAYREARLHGYEPQPGLALLHLAQGDTAMAATSIRRALRETPHRLPRARLMPAFVEIMLAIGDLENAATATRELDEIAQAQGTTVLQANAAWAAGMVHLASDEPARALIALRHAIRLWLDLHAPYQVARVRALIALACRRLGDEAARWELAAQLTEDLRGIDTRIRQTRKKTAAVVAAAGTSLTGLFGVGPVTAAAVIGDVRHVSRFPNRDHFAAYNGTAPVEVSSGGRKVYRLSRRGNRRLNHAIHMAAVTQIRYRHSPGRACYDKKLAEGKTGKEALRCLKRQISDAIFACLQAGAKRAAAAAAKSPGGQLGNHSAARAAGSHPDHRRFGQATPGPATHPTAPAAPAAFPALLPSRASRRTGQGPGAARPRGGAAKASLKRPPASR